MAFYSSISTLVGAIRVNRAMNAQAAMQDPGGKIAALISAVTILNANLSTIQVVLASANASGVSFSALSGVTFTQTMGTISNFTA